MRRFAYTPMLAAVLLALWAPASWSADNPPAPIPGSDTGNGGATGPIFDGGGVSAPDDSTADVELVEAAGTGGPAPVPAQADVDQGGAAGEDPLDEAGEEVEEFEEVEGTEAAEAEPSRVPESAGAGGALPHTGFLVGATTLIGLLLIGAGLSMRSRSRAR